MSSAALNSLYKRDGDFWAQYVKGRPKIPQSYFDNIFKYHADHKGSFDIAHDVGAGPAIHSAKLLDRFNHVIVSDAHEDHVKIAESQLKDYAGRCTFCTSTLENTIDTQPAQSVDLVFGQAMFHWTQQDKAMAAVTHQLKPGGTFAMSMVAFPVFTDPRVWDLWTRMLQSLIADGLHRGGGAYGPARAVMLSQLANLDSIPLSEEEFLPGALRIKMKDPLGDKRNFMRETVVGEEFKDGFPPWSEIGASDVVSYVDDVEGWAFTADYEGLRSIIHTFPFNHELEVQKVLWQEMKELIGDGKTEGIWPYSLVLATKR